MEPVNVHPRIQFVALLLLITCTPTIAGAQYSVQQCTWVLEQLTSSLTNNSIKQIISFERQYLTYCREYSEPADYAAHLGGLATGLNGDKQHQEALDVANRCLQINVADLSCLYEKANALRFLGRLKEAKRVAEKSLTLGAITVVDAAVTPLLRDLLVEVNAAITPPQSLAEFSEPDAAPPTPTSLAGSAKVTGGVPCYGTAVGHSIDINGEIDTQTVESVRRLFQDYHEVKTGAVKCKNSQPLFSGLGTQYSINSRGGNVAAAMAIGRMFRKERAWLGVGVNGERATCVSACVLILAGAVNREIGKLGTVGIHRPYFTSLQKAVTAEQVKEAYGRMLQDLRSYLKEMDVGERLADDMVAIEPEDVRFLTKSQLERYGLSGVARTEQQTKATENEAQAVITARSLGIDRAEYNRRKALGERICPSYSSDQPRAWLDCRTNVLRTGRMD